MTDNFARHSDNPSFPSRVAFAFSPNDLIAIDPIPKAIFVGTGGTIVGRSVDATADVTFLNLQPGQILDVRLEYIRATGTTAGNLVGLA